MSRKGQLFVVTSLLLLVAVGARAERARGAQLGQPARTLTARARARRAGARRRQAPSACPKSAHRSRVTVLA